MFVGHPLMFAMGLLQGNKVYKHGKDELHGPPVVALIVPTPLYKFCKSEQCSEFSGWVDLWKLDVLFSPGNYLYS